MRRFLSLLAITLLLAGVMVPGSTALAAEGRLSLAQAISKVKAAFPNLAMPDEFESSYGEVDGRGVWHLYWFSKTEPGDVSVSVDAKTGEIRDFNWYRRPDPNQEYAPIPKFSQEQARKSAEAFLELLIPEKLVACEPVPTELVRPFLQKRSWSVHYYFQWVRYANGIPFPANGINVAIDADTGDVVGYSLRWNDIGFPSPDDIKTPAQAQALLKEKGELELQYQWSYPRPGETGKPFLAYYYPNLNNLYIDAHSGEIRSDWYYYRAGEEKTMDQGMGNALGEYTPQEFAEIKDIEGLLKQGEIEQLARELFGIGARFEISDVQLVRDSQFPSLRMWAVSFYPQSEPYEVFRLNFDAKTGELLQLSHHLKHEDEPKTGNLRPEEAEAIAKAFIQQHNASRLEHFELEEMPTAEKELPQYYSFKYRRLVDGIPFTANYIYVTVLNDEHPRVMNYSLRWVDTEFPKADEALELEAAYDRLVAGYPLQLEYRLITEYSEKIPSGIGKDKVLLTYRLTEAPSITFDAIDFSPLNWRGEKVKIEEKHLPADVDGHWAKSDILYLAKVGIISVGADGLYAPNQDITVGQWLELLSRAAGWNIEDPIGILPYWAKDAVDQPHAGALKAAIMAGLILPDENIDMSRNLSRDELAMFAVRAFGYEKVAAIPGIYQLSLKDADQISQGRLGHVAIAWGFGLLRDKDGRIRPQDGSTRAECAVVLMRMLRMSR